jgi:hypothetical protein
MAVDCLGSLVRLCDEPLALRIHDDGTLTAGDRELLQEKLPLSRFVSRTEADEHIECAIPGLKNLKAVRRINPTLMKAVDAVLFCDEPLFACIDSDVLFLKRFRNPFVLPDDATNAVFMRDRKNAYSLRSWQKLAAGNLILPSCVNVGIICFRKNLIDLERMDWFVGNPRHNGIPSMIEQTAWAWLGMKAGCRIISDRQIRVMRAGEPDDQLVAGHFTARTRSLLPEYVGKSLTADSQAEPVKIETDPPGKCTVFALASAEVQRAFRKILQRPDYA